MEVRGGRQLGAPRGPRRRSGGAAGQAWTVRPGAVPAEVDVAHALLHERLRDVLAAYERFTLSAMETFAADPDAAVATEADLHELLAATSRIRRSVRRLCGARGASAGSQIGRPAAGAAQ